MEALVYFIRAGEGPVKIGVARDPERRRRELQTGHPAPLRVIAAVPGDERVERYFHRLLAEDHLHGEWFKPSDEVRRVVERAIAISDAGAERGWCELCRIAPVSVSRRRFCGSRCARLAKRATTKAWKEAKLAESSQF